MAKNELEQLRAELAAEKAKREEAEAKVKAGNGNAKPFSLKVSDKGGLSVYGLQRFPITLYKEQWEAILDRADEIRAFMLDNSGKLKKKA